MFSFRMRCSVRHNKIVYIAHILELSSTITQETKVNRNKYGEDPELCYWNSVIDETLLFMTRVIIAEDQTRPNIQLVLQFCMLLYILLLSMTLAHIESLTVDSGRIIDWQREDFMIDASKLDLIYYRAAVVALMKVWK